MKIDKHIEELRKRLPMLRKLRDLNQTELAERTGMTPAGISQIESGDRLPAFGSLIKIADALDVSVDYLIGRCQKSMHAGSTIDKLMKCAEQLPTKEMDLFIELARVLAKKNKSRNLKQ